jgi:uncharacterized protein YbaP (TraB family)
MKKILLSLVSLILAVSNLTAQNKKALLWEISGKELSKPSYLFGTIHLLCEDDLKITDNLKAALGKTQQLYLELDMDDPNMMQQMMQQMNMTDGTTLKSLLSEQDYTTVAKFFQQKTGFPLEMLASAKPFFVMSLALPSTMRCPVASWENSLVKLAKEQSMETLGLETLQEQMAVIDKIPYKDQAALLMETLRDTVQAQKDNQKLIGLYKSQDIDAMQSEIATASPTTAKYEEVLLQERNRRWTPQIARIAAEKPTFFAVGAGHLGGKNGVLQLLRKAGYQVKPIDR